MWTDPGNTYINRAQTHECGNWDCGRAIPRKGIHKWDFPFSIIGSPFLSSLPFYSSASSSTWKSWNTYLFFSLVAACPCLRSLVLPFLTSLFLSSFRPCMVACTEKSAPPPWHSSRITVTPDTVKKMLAIFPTGDGKIAKPFYSVHISLVKIVSL